MFRPFSEHVPVHLNPELRQSFKDWTLTCLCIFGKSFILNVNLIDQATPEGKGKCTHTPTNTNAHTHIKIHTCLHVTLQPPSLSCFKPCQTAPLTPPLICCWQQEASAVTAHPENRQPGRRTHKHKTEVRPVSTGVWRPAEVPRLCIVLICGVCICCCCVTALEMKEIPSKSTELFKQK